MARKTYEHSAYWYAKSCGHTRSDKASHVERLVDEVKRDLKFGGGRVNGNLSCDPIGFGVCLAVCTAMDIGIAMRETVRAFADPVERDRMRRELLRDLRVVRRPFYYARETARRRELAAERRKITRRTTLAPEPTPADVHAAWERRKDSKEDMIRLGGMLHDLECYVDNALRFNEAGDVVGRNGGIRGWLKENLPELSPKYKTLMRYKAMAIRLRQATGTKDPTPTSALLGDGCCEGYGADRTNKTDKTGKANETGKTSKKDATDANDPTRRGNGAMNEVVRELLKDFRITFSSLEEGLAQRLEPERVFLDAAKARRGAAKARTDSQVSLMPSMRWTQRQTDFSPSDDANYTIKSVRRAVLIPPAEIYGAFRAAPLRFPSRQDRASRPRHTSNSSAKPKSYAEDDGGFSKSHETLITICKL